MNDDRYSLVIGWLKILLPLVALGILSTLFLVSQRPDREAAVRYGDVQELARGSRVGAPAFSGVTEEGAIFSVRAREARADPDDPGRLVAEDLTADVEYAPGVAATVVAGTGAFDPATDRLDLRAGVRIATSSGYHLESDRLEMSLDTVEMVSPGQVEAAGPLGEISAGGMRLSRSPSGEHNLDFNEGVRLLYSPPNDAERP